MQITKSQNLILLSVLFLQPILNPSSFAFARRKSPPKAYSYIVVAGKASQGECDGEWKIPRKLKQQKEVPKVASYMGSEDDEGMWKHFFRAKSSCNAALAKTPSVLNDSQKTNKPELPQEDSNDSDRDPGEPPNPETN